MNRLFCRGCRVEGGRIVLRDPEQLRHLKVLRVVPGEELVLFDDLGNEFQCRFVESSEGSAVFSVSRELPSAGIQLPLIAVAVAIPKKSKIDDIIDKLTQLGCDRVIPIITERVIVRPDPKDLATRHARWQKIAEAATLQSGRNRVPQVDPAVKFPKLIEQSGSFDLKLIPTLEGERKPLAEALKGKSPSSILALIGPEGDFTPAETAAALSAGFTPVSFGKNVLRVETAALYVCSVLAFHFRSQTF